MHCPELTAEQISDLRLLARTIIPESASYGVPGADDVMLNYQSTSFHDALYVRHLLGLRPAPEFEAWLGAMGITDTAGGLHAQAPERVIAALPALSGP